MPQQDIGTLLKRLKDPDPAVRGRTADEINRISDPAVVPPLLAALMAADPQDRPPLVGFLGKFKDPRKVAPFVTLLRMCGEYDWECESLAKQVAEIGEAALRPLLAASSEPCGEEPVWLGRALAELGDPALQPLLAAAKSDNPRQRLRAVSALGYVGYGSQVGAQGYALAWQAVIAGLGDTARSVRLAALARLSELTRQLERMDGPPELGSAVPLLASMLKTEEDDSVCRAVTTAMVQIEGEDAIPALRAVFEGGSGHARDAARAALDSLAPPPPSPDLSQVALRNLRSPNPTLRAEAAALFGSSGDSSNTPHLVALLRDRNSLVRAAAVAALGELNAPATNHNDERARDLSCVPHLIALLKDRDAAVRKAVVVSLTAIFEPQAVPPIETMLKDPNAAVREAAAQSLGVFAEPEIVRAAPARRSASIKLLMAALSDTEATVRRAAAEALGAFQDPAALEALATLYRGSDAESSRAAFGGIARICDPASTPFLLEVVERPGNIELFRAVGALTCVLQRKPDPRAVAPLLKVFAETTYPWRGLLDALGATRDERVLEPLAGLTKSRDRDLRQYAVQALGALANSGAAPALGALMKDSDASVRLEAAMAFSMLGRFTAPPQLVEALTDDNSLVRSSAAQALAASGDHRAVPALIANIDSSQGVLIALGQSRDPRAVPPLMSYLRDRSKPPHSRGLAATGLGALGDLRAVDPLVAALDEDDHNVQLNAIRALGLLGDRRATEQLGRTLERWRAVASEKRHPAIYLAIAEALKSLGAKVPDP